MQDPCIKAQPKAPYPPIKKKMGNSMSFLIFFSFFSNHLYCMQIFFSMFWCCIVDVNWQNFLHQKKFEIFIFWNFNISSTNLISVEATKVLHIHCSEKNLAMNHGRTSHSSMHRLFIIVYPHYISPLLTLVHSLKFNVQAIVFKTMVQIQPKNKKILHHLRNF
jgi:hypothetical protein